MKRYFAVIWALTYANIKRFFRDKVAMFFTFLFPLMFLLVFGALNRDNDSISFDLVLINHSQTEFAEQFVSQIEESDTFTLNTDLDSFEAAREAMGRGEIDSIIELPEAFGQPNEQGVPSGQLVVYYEEASPQSGQTLAAIMQSSLDEINQNLTGAAEPFTVESRSTATANLSAFDYVFSGLVGFSILSLGIFGMANGFPVEKKTGSFRRLRVAPIGSSQLIFANMLNYLLVGLISVAILVVAALVIFDFNMRGSYLDFALFSLVSIVMMFGFGLAIGGWAKNEMQAAPLSNLVAFPMMFLSGVFFPRFLMPEWLQGITGYLPLAPVVDGLRFITAEGQNLLALGPQLAVIAGWTVIIYAIAIRVFRWE